MFGSSDEVPRARAAFLALLLLFLSLPAGSSPQQHSAGVALGRGPLCTQDGLANGRGRDFIIGYAVGYNNETIMSAVCPFIRSVRLHAPCSVMVILTDAKPSMNRLLGSGWMAGVEVVSAMSQHEAAAWANTTLPPRVHPMSLRFFDYTRFLEANLARMRGVMITDVRDVVIQGPLWHLPVVRTALAEDQVIFSLEGDVATLKRDGSMDVDPKTGKAQPHYRTRSVGNGANWEWASKCGGSAAAEAIKAKPISGAGITMGSATAVLAYLRAMLRAMRAAPAECLTARAHDQGLHNLVVHQQAGNGTFKSVKLPNGRSPVWTAFRGFPLTLDAFYHITVERPGGYTFYPTVVHQFDRAHTLTNELRKAYACLAQPAPFSIAYNT